MDIWGKLGGSSGCYDDDGGVGIEKRLKFGEFTRDKIEKIIILSSFSSRKHKDDLRNVKIYIKVPFDVIPSQNDNEDEH